MKAKAARQRIIKETPKFSSITDMIDEYSVGWMDVLVRCRKNMRGRERFTFCHGTGDIIKCGEFCRLIAYHP